MRNDSGASQTRRIARNMLRDLVPCADFDDVSRRLGFIPASDDVEYVEHVTCHRRRETVEPLMPLIAQLATGAAQVIAGVEGATRGPVSPEQIGVYEAVSRGAAYCVITQLVDHGYLGVYS